jgi:hypothetical protein
MVDEMSESVGSDEEEKRGGDAIDEELESVGEEDFVGD